jgi:hypothetical protein
MVEIPIADPAFFGLVVATTPPAGAKIGPGASINVMIGVESGSDGETDTGSTDGSDSGSGDGSEDG